MNWFMRFATSPSWNWMDWPLLIGGAVILITAFAVGDGFLVLVGLGWIFTGALGLWVDQGLRQEVREHWFKR